MYDPPWILKDPAARHGSCYIEILPGPWNRRHWQPGSIFVDEEAFGLASGLVMRHWPSYDHYYENEVPSHALRAIVAELRAAARQLVESPNPDVHEILDRGNSVYSIVAPDEPSPTVYAAFLEELASELERVSSESERIFILGI